MKLKERLAHQYLETQGYIPGATKIEGPSGKAFLAGFEKCRKLSYRLASEMAIPIECVEEFEILGEEEVE